MKFFRIVTIVVIIIAVYSFTKSKPKTCYQVVVEILTTSKRYKQLTKGLYERVVKNGGTSYGIMLEGSPNPKQDTAMQYSKTYDFNLHESYPDREPVIARFTFDKKKRQLYEYDVVNDELKAIDFNKKLLLELDKACK